MRRGVSDETNVPSLASAREVRAAYWGVRDQPLRSVVVAAVCVGVGTWAALLSASGSMGTLAALALAAACWKCWIPLATHLGPGGITICFLGRCRRIAWRAIEQVETHPDGVLLWPTATRSDKVPGDGFYLPWPHHPELVAGFHRQFGPVTVPDIAPH